MRPLPTITAPAGGALLTSFSFEMNLPSSVAFRGEVYAWNGTNATGSNLFESTVTSTSGSGMQLITFNIPGGLVLASGQQYVLFASTAKDQSGHSGTGNWGAWTSSVYGGGNTVFLSTGPDNGDGWTTLAWGNASDKDLAFKATFAPNDFRIDAPAHTYAEEGTYHVTVDVTHEGAATQTVTGATITVNDPPVTVNAGAALTAIDEGTATPLNAVIGTFTDTGNPSGTIDSTQTSAQPEYKVVIDWGDSTPTTRRCSATWVHSTSGGVGLARHLRRQRQLQHHPGDPSWLPSDRRRRTASG